MAATDSAGKRKTVIKINILSSTYFSVVPVIDNLTYTENITT